MWAVQSKASVRAGGARGGRREERRFAIWRDGTGPTRGNRLACLPILSCLCQVFFSSFFSVYLGDRRRSHLTGGTIQWGYMLCWTSGFCWCGLIMGGDTCRRERFCLAQQAAPSWPMEYCTPSFARVLFVCLFVAVSRNLLARTVISSF